MSVNTYSLADYQVTIRVTDRSYANDLGSLTFGGYGADNKGSFTESISVSRASDTWATSGDYTGSWVHNKNLDSTGTVTLRLRQVSDDVIKLKILAEYMKNHPVTEGMEITISGANSATVASAKDSYIVKVPEQAYGNSAEWQDWVFTSGQIIFPEADITLQ